MIRLPDSNKEMFGFDSFDLPQDTNEKTQEESWGEIILNDKGIQIPILMIQNGINGLKSMTSQPAVKHPIGLKTF